MLGTILSSLKGQIAFWSIDDKDVLVCCVKNSVSTVGFTLKNADVRMDSMKYSLRTEDDYNIIMYVFHSEITNINTLIQIATPILSSKPRAYVQCYDVDNVAMVKIKKSENIMCDIEDVRVVPKIVNTLVIYLGDDVLSNTETVKIVATTLVERLIAVVRTSLDISRYLNMCIPLVREMDVVYDGVYPSVIFDSMILINSPPITINKARKVWVARCAKVKIVECDVSTIIESSEVIVENAFKGCVLICCAIVTIRDCYGLAYVYGCKNIDFISPHCNALLTSCAPCVGKIVANDVKFSRDSIFNFSHFTATNVYGYAENVVVFGNGTVINANLSSGDPTQFYPLGLCKSKSDLKEFTVCNPEEVEIKTSAQITNIGGSCLRKITIVGECDLNSLSRFVLLSNINIKTTKNVHMDMRNLSPLIDKIIINTSRVADIICSSKRLSGGHIRVTAKRLIMRNAQKFVGWTLNYCGVNYYINDKISTNLILDEKPLVIDRDIVDKTLSMIYKMKECTYRNDTLIADPEVFGYKTSELMPKINSLIERSKQASYIDDVIKIDIVEMTKEEKIVTLLSLLNYN